MLTDVFVPLLTYPDETPVVLAAGLPVFLSRFATSATFCPVEIDVPDLANRWGGALIALPEMISQVEARSRKLARELEEATTHAGGKLHSSHQMVRAMFGEVGQTLLPLARYHDLSLVLIQSGSEDKAMLAETLLFGTSRPVLLAPETDLSGFDLGRVAIAWDGGRCAGRAVFDAMPMLADASDVTIITASDDKRDAGASVRALFAYLDRHDIVARHVDIPSAGDIGTKIGRAHV